ncbi:hypothetical protein Ddye_009944 [Dipteronia dyeriana]|uniref:Uncharacterized protein n=1 Tax=Dipteronia dyeriana TaxID=168575 RepID=A0AAE0CMR5_9ROSI|nr:hypothetical protein Ddye_009944 [Dipteronia dyeriana]
MASKYHVRSISLPSISHPTTIKIEEELRKLRESLDQESSTSSSGSFCVSGLSGIEELYLCLDDILIFSMWHQPNKSSWSPSRTSTNSMSCCRWMDL